MFWSQEAIKFWLKLIQWASRLLGIASVVAATLTKVAPSSLGLTSADSDPMIQKAALITLPLLLVLVPAVDALRRHLERRTFRPLVKEVLEEFRKQIFAANLKDPSHHHRVTLFKHCKWVGRREFLHKPKLGWLRITDRTGHTTQNSRTVFFAPNDPEKAEGVAGWAWAWAQTVFKEDLPDLSGSPTEGAIKDYAAASNSNQEYIARAKPPSRSICGIPIEVQGRIWGVLVIDSRSPKLPQRLIKAHEAVTIKFLSRILERV